MSRIAIAGAAGRMGRQLLSAVSERTELQLTVALEHPQSLLLGSDAGLLYGSEATGVELVADIAEVVDDFDTIVDFTSPASTAALLEFAATHGKTVVVGTTGLTDEHLRVLDRAANATAIVYAANYSVGVTLSLELLQRASEVLGDRYDIEIHESHHRHKVDAPSGTALRMGEAVAAGMRQDLKDCAVYDRHGITGAREDRKIGFAVTRAGDIIGEHTVMFCGEGERLEITHRATDRMTFARGAVRAAGWLAGGREPGRYDMSDVLRPEK